MPREAALNVLKATPYRSCSTAEIAEALRDRYDEETVSAALKDLRDEGVIEHDLLGGWFVLSR